MSPSHVLPGCVLTLAILVGCSEHQDATANSSARPEAAHVNAEDEAALTREPPPQASSPNESEAIPTVAEERPAVEETAGAPEESERPEADEADTDEADTDEADTDEADTDEADTDEHEADEAEADEPGADQAGETSRFRLTPNNQALETVAARTVRELAQCESGEVEHFRVAGVGEGRGGAVGVYEARYTTASGGTRHLGLVAWNQGRIVRLSVLELGLSESVPGAETEVRTTPFEVQVADDGALRIVARKRETYTEYPETGLPDSHARNISSVVERELTTFCQWLTFEDETELQCASVLTRVREAAPARSVSREGRERTSPASAAGDFALALVGVRPGTIRVERRPANLATLPDDALPEVAHGREVSLEQLVVELGRPLTELPTAEELEDEQICDSFL